MLKGNGAARIQTQHSLAEIYLKLMRDSHLWTDGLDSALRTVITTANTALGTQRAGLWSFGPERQTLTLTLGYDAAKQDFEYGAELQCAQFPEYFCQLELLQIEAISDVQREPRLHELVAQGVLSPELKAMLSCTVLVTSTSWGVLVVSDFVKTRQWSEWERWFVASVANLIAQLITYAEVHRSERWLRFVADNLPIGVLKFDLDARCDYVNPYWQHMTATDAEAAYGTGWLQCVHPEDRDAMLDKIRMVGVSGERSDAELRLLIPNKTIWVACSWVSERNVEGMPIAILGTFTDVTHVRMLHENERRYRALFDNSGDAIFLVQGDRFVDCNARVLEMFACTREQIIGEPPYRFSPQQQPDGFSSQEKAVEKISAALRGERQFFEWRHTRYDGSQFDAEVTLTCVTLNDEPHLLAAVRDISERKAAEDALRQSSERLHRINSIAARLYGLRDLDAVACASVEIFTESEAVPLASFFVYDAAAQVITRVAQSDGRSLAHRSHVQVVRQVSNVSDETDIEVLSDMDALSISVDLRAKMHARGTRSIVHVWLRGEGARIGLIVLEYRDVVTLDDDQREDFSAIGKAISMALSNVLYIARLERQTAHDSTGAR